MYHRLFFTGLRKTCYILCLTIGLLYSHTCLGQYNPAFDSLLRAAKSDPDPDRKLARLRPLADRSYEGSVFQAISFGNAYLDAASEVKSDTDMYYAHLALCTAYERNRNFERSASHGLQAVSIAGKRNDPLKQIRALQDIAFVYTMMGQVGGQQPSLQKALDYCYQAMAISREHGIKQEEPYVLLAAANVYAVLKKYDTAIKLYKRSIMSREAQHMGSDVNVYINLGITLKNSGRYPEALNAYRIADSIARTLEKSQFLELSIADNRAILYGAMGRIQESEQLAKRVLEEAREQGAVGIQEDIIGHLKKLCSSQGRYREALAYADSQAAIKERVLNEEKTRQLAELEARFDAGAKDEQIIGQQQALRKGRRQNLQLWAGIALLFIVGCVTYAGLRRSRRLNRKISSQQQQLVLQKNELEHNNELKNQLFTLISHDVRVPLNSLMAYATLLDHQDDLPPEKIRKYNADLREALGATTVLMENLLQFAKAQIRAPQPYPEIIQLSVVMDRVLKLLQPAITQKRIVLQVDCREETTVFADEDMTEVILRNLVSNAIKFSNSGGTVAISINHFDDVYGGCSIQDSGAGMKPELTALWNGTSVPAPVRSRMGTQYEKGAGLGLMLSKTFTMIMGGSLSVKSKEDEGSVFLLLLPREQQVG